MAKIRTIQQLLSVLGACERAYPKYAKLYGKDSRAFKTAFINLGRVHAEWLGWRLFESDYILSTPDAANYPEFPAHTYVWSGESTNRIKHYTVGRWFKKRENRKKYWPAVRRRLEEIGVRF